MSVGAPPSRSLPGRLAPALAWSALLVGLGWVGWWALRPRPVLDEAIPLAEAGRFDEAEARVRAYLRYDPGSDAAHLLLAQVLLRRPDPPGTPRDRPTAGPGREALAHLDRVRPRDPRMAVLLPVYRGRALHRLLRLREAEASWLEALRIDPAAPDAGWSLLDLYYLQGREDDARRLALRLVEHEPDPRDRVQLLLELVRQDARPPAAGSLVNWFEPVVRQDPDDLHSAVALGLALVRDGRIDRGLEVLRDLERRHPGRPEVLDGLLTGLEESGLVDDLADAIDRLPPALADDPRLLKHRARVALDRRDWPEAVRLYRLARRPGRYDRVVEHRLGRALRHVGGDDEADAIDRRLRRRDVAIQQVRPLYDEADQVRDLNPRDHADLLRRIADAREQMQLFDEARAWHRLILGDDPQDEESRAALARLATETGRDERALPTKE